MRISEFFVPYHPGSPRYYDLSTYNFKLETIPAAGCPASAGGTLVSPRVCQEIRDRGLLWMSGPKNASSAMRGQELVLWGVIYAANYKYIERYTFRDDGTILGEEGATAQNLPGSETVTHVHNALWRIDLDLYDITNDTMHMQHNESIAGPTANDVMPPIATASGIQYNVRTHDAVMITNTGYQNAQKHHPSYILMPSLLGGGLTQHQEPFAQNDFWVTPYNPTQMAASQLPSYVAGRPSVAHRDVVLWYKGSLHHHPRDEDGAYANGGNGPWHGTALAMYAGFMLMPFDVFDCTPFFGPCP
jgi:Cu2+-containing amine oxidase